MHIELRQQPTQAIAHVHLAAEEELITQAGALIGLKGPLAINTFMRRGGDTGKRKLFQAQTKPLFLQSFKAGSEEAELYLAPSLIGNLAQYEMNKYKFIIRHSSYLASSGKIEIFIGFENFKAKAGMENSTWLSLVGDGLVIVSGLGGVYPVEIENQYSVNLEHIVAFENTLKTKIISENKGWTGGGSRPQEVICQFRGQGLLYCQTHRPKAMAKLLEKESLPDDFKLQNRSESFKLKG